MTPGITLEGLLMLCNLHFYWVKMLIDHFTGQRWGSPNKLHSTLIHSNVTMRFWVLPRPVARTNWEACWKSGENTTENTAGLGWLGVRGMSQHPAGTNRTRASWCRPDLETRKSCKDRGWLNLAIPLKNHPRGKKLMFPSLKINSNLWVITGTDSLFLWNTWVAYDVLIWLIWLWLMWNNHIDSNGCTHVRVTALNQMT